MKTASTLSLRVVLFLLLAIGLIVCVHVSAFLLRTPSADKTYREIVVPEGMSFRGVAAELESLGVIEDADMFVMLGRLMGVTKKINTGFYSLNTNMRPLDVIRLIVEGKVIEYQLVIPEGYSIYDIANLMNREGILSSDEFMRLATDPEYVSSLGLEGDTLEGYLFPATYFIPKGVSSEAVIKRLVSKFREVFNEDMQERAGELGLTRQEAVTLASLIETEALVDEERFIISAVYHNRLKRGMLLQCDPTVIYAMKRAGRWQGNITRSDLRLDDPYNTYVNPGLPPGPVANPGRPSIIAALNPADVDYIFFVSKGDGTHFFSNRLSEHNQAVREYQMRPKPENTDEPADEPDSPPVIR